MSNGKFSQPRPYRDEEREIEQAFRAITGQAPPPEPQPKADDYGPVSGDFETGAIRELSEELLKEDPDLDDLSEEEYDPEEPDFIDRVLDVSRKAASFCGKNPKLVTVSICSVVLVALLGFLAAFLFGNSDPYGGKILPNVTIAGINLGGMTKAEAVSALKQGTGYSREDMVIDLSGTQLRLTPEAAKVSLDAKGAVNEAYSYGRTGSKEDREMAYAASRYQTYTVDLAPYLSVNQAYIRSLLNGLASEGGSTLRQTNYGLEGKMPQLSADKWSENAPCQTLVINMGTPGVGFDPEAVARQVLDAYVHNEFLVTVEQVDSRQEPDPLDLDRVYAEFYVEPVSASYDAGSGRPIPGSYGYGFDLEAARKMVENASYGETLRIPMEYIEPEFLGDGDFFRDVLGSLSTRIPRDENQAGNIALAAKALNGIVVNPGEGFSFNRTLGEPTTAKGYTYAPASGTLEQNDILGGGISHVASHLYACALLADLTVTERSSHEFQVPEIDSGLDAQAAWNGPDLRFRNTTDFPIRIEIQVSGGYLETKLLGTDNRDYEVELDSTLTETIEPGTEYQDFAYDNEEGYADGDVIQKGIPGGAYSVYTLKYDKTTGRLIAKDLVSTSRYAAADQVVARVEPEETEETEETQQTEPDDWIWGDDTDSGSASTQPNRGSSGHRRPRN